MRWNAARFDRYGVVAIAIHWISAVLTRCASSISGCPRGDTVDAAAERRTFCSSCGGGASRCWRSRSRRIAGATCADDKPLPARMDCRHVAGAAGTSASARDCLRRDTRHGRERHRYVGTIRWLEPSCLAVRRVPLPDFVELTYHGCRIGRCGSRLLVALLALQHGRRALVEHFVRRDRLLARMGHSAAEGGGRAARRLAEILVENRGDKSR